MRALRVVGVTEGGDVVLEDRGRRERFTVPADEQLRAAARGDLTRLGQIAIELESQLRPREIQARIRAGASVEQVASAAGVPLQKIERFAYPVLLERSRTAEVAQRAHPVRADGPDIRTLGDVVAHTFGLRGQDYADAEWDSWKGEDGRWVVALSWRAGRSDNRAHWTFQPGANGGTVTAVDEHASDLVEGLPARPLRPVGPVIDLASRPEEAGPAPQPAELRAAASGTVRERAPEWERGLPARNPAERGASARSTLDTPRPEHSSTWAAERATSGFGAPAPVERTSVERHVSERHVSERSAPARSPAERPAAAEPAADLVAAEKQTVEDATSGHAPWSAGTPLTEAAPASEELAVDAPTPSVAAPAAVEETPVGETPVVDAPVESRGAGAPVVPAPVDAAPVVDPPAAESPVAEPPIAEPPVVDAPVAEEPAAETPAAEEPVDAPVAESAPSPEPRSTVPPAQRNAEPAAAPADETAPPAPAAKAPVAKAGGGSERGTPADEPATETPAQAPAAPPGRRTKKGKPVMPSWDEVLLGVRGQR